MTARVVLAVRLLALGLTANALADEPVTSYIFPAGGQRGSQVEFKVGGLYLHDATSFEMLGAGVQAKSTIERTETLWFEGPLVPLPASQQAEDYPKDYAGQVTIAADAALGARPWRVWNSQGVTSHKPFVVGEFPEIVEREIDGQPIPTRVQPPVTINGRIFPREDVDVWTFTARASEEITCEVQARELESPFDARLEALDASGRRLAEALASATRDPRLVFRAPADGEYQLRIHDVNYGGLQNYVYRLLVTRGPRVHGLFPLGARRGTTTKLELRGAGLPQGELSLAIPPDAANPYVATLPLAEGQTQELSLEVDDFPEFRESEAAQPRAVPAIFNGRIAAPGEADVWRLALKKAEQVELDLRARRLSSSLNSVLVVLDPAGKELARNDDLSGEETDSRLAFQAAEEGVYTVRVEERYPSRGGADFAYRLKVSPPSAPDFRLRFSPAALTVTREETGLTEAQKKNRKPPKPAQWKIEAERLGGFTGEIVLLLDGLPEGVTPREAKIPEKQNQADITFKADPKAKIQVRRVAVLGRATINGQVMERRAGSPPARGLPSLDHAMFAVAMPTPFRVYGEYLLSYGKRGSVYTRHFRLDRGNFTGPLTIRLADRQTRHLQGVHGPILTLPPEATSFDYPLTLPSWMEIGRTSRSVVMACGKVRDHDGTEHDVSYSSAEQNDQIIAVVEEGLMKVEAKRPSIVVEPNGRTDVAVRLLKDRSLADKPVRLDLVVPGHIRDVSAKAVDVSPGAVEAALPVTFGPSPGPFNLPISLRATLAGPDGPIVSEAPIEFVGL